MRRVLLKLSGEALAPTDGTSGIDPTALEAIVAEIASVVGSGAQLAMVLGGGNLFRGARLKSAGMDGVTADQLGMLATVMNGLAVRERLAHAGLDALLLSAFPVPGIAAGFSRDLAVSALEAGTVVVLSGGTGNPFFTTDTAACLRAIELQADAVLKATKVDGVYSADPLIEPDAERFDELSYDETLRRQLGVMDLTAICLCRDHDMPVVVFDMNARGALTAIINGDKVGTRIVAR
jgi:uridylate kinase